MEVLVEKMNKKGMFGILVIVSLLLLSFSIIVFISIYVNIQEQKQQCGEVGGDWAGDGFCVKEINGKYVKITTLEVNGKIIVLERK